MIQIMIARRPHTEGDMIIISLPGCMGYVGWIQVMLALILLPWDYHNGSGLDYCTQCHDVGSSDESHWFVGVMVDDAQNLLENFVDLYLSI